MERILTDDFGRLILLPPSAREQVPLSKHISSINSLSQLLSSSLGPSGLDKAIQTEHGELLITNDGATILSHLGGDHITNLAVDLSAAQDEEIGDGTTSVVIISGEMLRRAGDLVEQGVHRVRVIRELERACERACEHLKTISYKIHDKEQFLLNAARTSLNSKIVSRALDQFARVCVDAVKLVFDYDMKDISLEKIKIMSRVSSSLAETRLIRGVLLMKEVSHPQMHKEVANANIALLACPFEPPKIKTKHTLKITNEEDYQEVEAYEKSKFVEMIQSLKNANVNVVLCQWGFDDEANSLLAEKGILAVRWVGGSELEQLGVLTGGNIISRFEDLKESDLGHGSLREESIGTENDKIIIIENKNPTCTILINGCSETIIEEAKRCVRDALCSVRNVLIDDNVVYGGGSCEISCAMDLRNNGYSSAFAAAMDEIPLCLARNAGHDPIKTIGQIRLRQRTDGLPYIGVGVGKMDDDMMQNGVFDTVYCKTKQYKMATQLVTSILKIDDVIIGRE